MDKIHMKAKQRAMGELHSLMSDVEKKKLASGKSSPMVSKKHPTDAFKEEPEVGESEEHEMSETPKEEASEHPSITRKTGERDGKAVTGKRANPGDDMEPFEKASESAVDATETIDQKLSKYLLKKHK